MWAMAPIGRRKVRLDKRDVMKTNEPIAKKMELNEI
jgi:hypothetical protein